jgi:hypothetical protein
MKEKHIKFRCTGTEKERIEGMARRSGTTLSEYCRQQSLTGRILATPKLTPEEVSYFRSLKEHNNGLARIASLIRNKQPGLYVSTTEFLEKSRELCNRFF